jgi:hypothetical protein
MSIVPPVACLLVDTPVGWTADWVWGLPLIVLTSVIHVFGLTLIRERALRTFKQISRKHHPRVVFVAIIGATTLSATILHIGEAGVWAFAYKSLGALPNYRTAMLYSLNAITSYGHTNVSLEDYWHLMGALEALNGWLLFGLSTAFLFGVIAKVWSVFGRLEQR